MAIKKNPKPYLTIKFQASITYYSLAFFLFFSSFFYYHVKMDLQFYLTQKHLSVIDQRLALEGIIFTKVRDQIDTHTTKEYSYEVVDNILKVSFNLDIPIYAEYDIIEDESFVWRRNYDYIE